MKIKIGLGIFIIIAVIVGSVFLSAYRSQSASSDALEEKIRLDTLNIGKINQSAKTANNQTAEINIKILETQAEIDVAGNEIMDGVNANAIIKAVYAQSTTDQVSLLPLSTQQWSQLSNSDLQVFRISFTAAGIENNLVSFIQWLQNSPYNSLVVESYSLNRSVDQDGAVSYISQIDLALYSK
jgi:hypothetical protein